MTESDKNSLKRSPTKRHKDSPLNEQDWIDEAFKILVVENVRGIRIDTLCKKLGVTKGSFYWHFKARDDLLVALLQNWRRRMTLNVIKSLMKYGNTAAERLYSLMDLTRRKNSAVHAQIEMSIRDWARRVNMAEDAVREVDQLRIDYFSSLFREMGHDEETSEKRAYLSYCLMMGDSILHRTLEGKYHQDHAKNAVEMLLGSELSEADLTMFERNRKSRSA